MYLGTVQTFVSLLGYRQDNGGDMSFTPASLGPRLVAQVRQTL